MVTRAPAAETTNCDIKSNQIKISFIIHYSKNLSTLHSTAVIQSVEVKSLRLVSSLLLGVLVWNYNVDNMLEFGSNHMTPDYLLLHDFTLYIIGNTM